MWYNGQFAYLAPCIYVFFLNVQLDAFLLVLQYKIIYIYIYSYVQYEHIFPQVTNKAGGT